MSAAFHLNLLIHDCIKDPQRMKAFLEDRKGVANQYGLSDEEIQALVQTDVGKLFRLGANPLILIEFALGLGATVPEYLDAVRKNAV